MEKELHHISLNEARTYRRIAAHGEATVDASLLIPEGATAQPFEDSMSDFLTPGFVLKRSFDIVVSAIVLLFSLPLLGIIALAIRSGSRGPVFHNVFRTGMGFRVFKVYGFRTTRAGAQRMVENLTHIKGKFGAGDTLVPAPTHLGRMLRITGLDMLPMFFNVLRGDLSLVGNRALPIHEASKLVTDMTCARFGVPAGIWGPGGRNDLRSTRQDRQDLLVVELEYTHTCSFMVDMRILFHALKRSWKRMRRYSSLAINGDF